MTRILLIGGGGFVGRRLARRLGADGCEVSSLALEAGPDRDSGIDHICGDRDDPRLLQGLAGRRFDVVVDLVAYHGAQTRQLVSHFAGKARRIVHLSTVASMTGSTRSSRGKPTGLAATERDSSYRSGKAECETVLEAAGEHGIDYAIVRCPPLIGPGDAASREGYILDRLLR